MRGGNNKDDFTFGIDNIDDSLITIKTRYFSVSTQKLVLGMGHERFDDLPERRAIFKHFESPERIAGQIIALTPPNGDEQATLLPQIAFLVVIAPVSRDYVRQVGERARVQRKRGQNRQLEPLTPSERDKTLGPLLR